MVYKNNTSATGLRMVAIICQQVFTQHNHIAGERSTTENCAGIVCNHCDWLDIIVNQSSISLLRPPKTFLLSIWSQGGFTCSKQNLGTKSSQCPSCDLYNLSATSRRPCCNPLQSPCDHPKIWSQGGRWQAASYVWPGLSHCKGPSNMLASTRIS